MKIIRSNRKTLVLQIRDGELIVRAPIFTLSRRIDDFVNKNQDWIQKNIQNSKRKKALSPEEINILKGKAKSYIIARVEELAGSFGIDYNKIRITSAKTRWGSCSSKKNLNFSYRLMLLPLEIIDYVIIHELAHLKYMNHAPEFWQHVEFLMPDYREKEKWLKQYGSSI